MHFLPKASPVQDSAVRACTCTGLCHRGPLLHASRCRIGVFHSLQPLCSPSVLGACDFLENGLCCVPVDHDYLVFGTDVCLYKAFRENSYCKTSAEVSF